MNKFDFYQDVKVTVWQRQHFTIEAETAEEAREIAKRYTQFDVSCEDDVDVSEVEWLCDTEELITPEENGGCATIEVYEREGKYKGTLIADNAVSKELSAKEEERKFIGYQIDFGKELWPEGLFSFQVFRTKEAATEFLEEKKLEGFHLVEIYEGDIEEPSFIGMKPIVFKESLSEQELFDLFARVFQDEDVDIYNEDAVYGMATHLFAKSCGKIESIFTWLKDDDSTGEQCWYDKFHDEVVSLYCSMLKGEVRCCDYCGKPMKEGYYLFGEYACSDECCLALFNGDKKQMDESLSDDSGDNDTYYWTEWKSIYKD